MRILLLIAFLLTTTNICFAQAQISSGDITGTVSDASGAAISGAKITATNPSSGLDRSVSSNSEGTFRISLLPPGTYSVRVEASGFSPGVLDRVQVRVGDSVVLPVQLQVGTATTEISVIAEPPVVETERTQQANTIQGVQIRNLPINRRSYLDFALLTPGVVETTSMVDGSDYRVVQAPQSGLSFGGSNGRGNNFAIDGAENYVNSGGVRPSVSQETVAEFQVNRNSFSAELGNATGGAINIITRSGTNQVRGNVFGFLRNRAIQAHNYFDPVSGGSAYTRSQEGATIGGPIRKDKTFFFAGYERLDRHETSFVPITQDPNAFNSLTASQQQLIDFFNASGVPQLRGLAQQLTPALLTTSYPATLNLFRQNSGTFPYSEYNNQFLARLDHRFSTNHSAFLRFNLTDGYSESAQLGALIAYNRGRNIGQKDYTTVLSDTVVLSPRWIAESRGMFSYYSFDITTIDPNGPSIDISGYGLFGRDIFLPSKVIERHWQASEVLSYTNGRHDIRFGAEYNPVRDNAFSTTFFSGRFSFGEVVPLGQLLNTVSGDPGFTTTLAQTLTALGQSRLVPNLSQPLTALQSYNLGLPAYYQQGFGDPNWVGVTHRYNFFVQDNWRVHPRLTLNLGIRYELEHNPPLVGMDPNNIAPRFGFAWNVTGDNKTVVRGGAGIFYGPNNLQIANVADALSGRYIQQVFVPLSQTPGLNNALTGRPLTSADIYQTLYAEGVIGHRAITRQDLAQFGLSPNPNLPFAVIFGIDTAHWQNPYSEQASLEVERSVGGFALSAAYNWNRGAHLPRILDRNLLYGPRRPDGEPTFTFVNPLIFQRNIFESTANSFYSAGIFQVNRRFSSHWSLNAHYTLSRAIDETTDFNTDFQPHDQLNARGDRALSAFHQKHRFVLNSVLESGSKNVFLRNWLFSPIFVANSGRPFNILTGVDNMGDRRVTTHRPSRAGRNIGVGPAYASLDARLTRRFPISEKLSIEFIAEGFNLLNRTNFRTVNNVVGNITVEQLPADKVGIRAPTYLPFAFTSAFDPRQFQFGLKLNF